MPTFTLSARCPAQPASTDPDQHITYVSFDALTIHYTLKCVKFCKADNLSYFGRCEAHHTFSVTERLSITPELYCS